MNRKLVKVLAIIMLIICVLLLVNGEAFAGGDTKLTGDNIKSIADGWLQQGQSKSPLKASEIANILKPIANILLAFGAVIILIVGVVMGIKFVTASPDKQGQLKGQLFGVFISAIVLAGAYGIWSITYTILNGLTR